MGNRFKVGDKIVHHKFGTLFVIDRLEPDGRGGVGRAIRLGKSDIHRLQVVQGIYRLDESEYWVHEDVAIIKQEVKEVFSGK
jgi:hypothetical protein